MLYAIPHGSVGSTTPDGTHLAKPCPFEHGEDPVAGFGDCWQDRGTVLWRQRSCCAKSQRASEVHTNGLPLCKEVLSTILGSARKVRQTELKMNLTIQDHQLQVVWICPHGAVR